MTRLYDRASLALLGVVFFAGAILCERIRLVFGRFRKVRPVAAPHSEIVHRILNAKPGADRKREGV